MWHVFYTYNLYEKSTGWQLEPSLRLLIWIMVLGCSPLQATAGWHHGSLLARSPGGSLRLPSPSRGYRSRLCTGFPTSSRVSWEHWSEQLHFGPLTRLRYRCRCKVILCRHGKDAGPPQGWRSGGRLPPPPDRLWVAGICWPRPCICLPDFFSCVQLLFCSNLDTWLRAGIMPRLHFDPVVHCYCIRE